MTRHRGSKEADTAKKRPRKAFSFMSLGSRTKGWDKNAPRSDCPYGIFGKRMQRSLMGFGSLVTAIYSQEMITEATLNASHGILNPGKGNMRYFHERLGFHRDGVTTEYQTMRRAVTVLLRQFPGIKHDIEKSKQNGDALIQKIRRVMKGAHAARNTDANSIRSNIFTLSHDDAKKRGWSMPAKIEKSNRGIKSECTARFLLSFKERDEYLKDPEALVERNQIKLSLTDTWPAILYDENMVNDEDELAGLFRSETLLRCGITILKPKESNAEINGIKRITPETIAYFSTLAIFAIHDSLIFCRDLGGIDLSEVYHDVVAALRMKTEWAVQTLAFWNNNLLGSSLEKEKKKKPSQGSTAKIGSSNWRQNNEREGLMVLDADPPRLPAITPPRPQGVQNLDNSGLGSPTLDDAEDRVSLPPKSKNTQKRRMSVPDSDLDLDPESEPDSDPDSDGKQSDAATPPPKKVPRHSIDREHSPATVRPTAARKKQTTQSSSSQLQDNAEDDNHVNVGEWDAVCKELKKSIKYATAASLKEATNEFTKIVSMRAEKGTRYYNEHWDRLGLVLKIPATKKKGPQRAKKVVPGARRITRSISRREGQDDDDDELDPPAKIDKLINPPVVPSRRKR
ncbi:hypothetical protein BJ322DRAFT_1114383 [Thelephora terrestris]|uniref:Uncharacterized protein n=1 Tax=Thelephora terrestris TaxID=56493 RepID=A0A9P6L1F0_9AGAM|nr:hypothetical protein BJ322DRAFT_1114383 [Thelephora terrestris]